MRSVSGWNGEWGSSGLVFPNAEEHPDIKARAICEDCGDAAEHLLFGPLSRGHVTFEKSPLFWGHSVTICKMGGEGDLMLSKVSSFFNFPVEVQTAAARVLFCWLCYVQEARVPDSCLSVASHPRVTSREEVNKERETLARKEEGLEPGLEPPSEEVRAGGQEKPARSRAGRCLHLRTQMECLLCATPHVQPHICLPRHPRVLGARVQQ